MSYINQKATITDVSVNGVFDFKQAKFETTIGEMKVFDKVVPSWLIAAQPYASAALSVMGALAEQKYRAAVMESLKAIYKKLEQIESRIEDLHDRLNELFEEVDELKEFIKDIPSDVSLHRANGFLTRFKLGDKMTDNEFVDAFQDYSVMFFALISASNSKWFTVHLPTLCEMLVCYLVSISRYALIEAKGDVGEAKSIFQSRCTTLGILLREVRQNVVDTHKQAEIAFSKVWNSRVREKDFGLGPQHRAFKADWNSKIKKLPRRCELPDKHYFRLLEERDDMTFYFRNVTVPKKNSAYFWRYHHVMLNENSGLFETVNKMVILPQEDVELKPNPSGKPPLEEFSLIGVDSPTVQQWASTFSLELARKYNPRFKGDNKRHEINMRNDLRAINKAWRQLITIGTNLPIADKMIDYIDNARLMLDDIEVEA